MDYPGWAFVELGRGRRWAVPGDPDRGPPGAAVRHPRWLEILGNIFRQAQKQVEDTTTRLFGDVAPPQAAAR